MDFDASRPIWLQLREEFTRRIVIGRWAPGKQIPGVRERDGLCRSERAVGRFVTDDVDRVSRLRCDLAVGAADEFTTRVKGFGLTEAEAVALIAERWNQQ